MEFAKYYNVTKNVLDLVNKNLLKYYDMDYFKEIYICEDVHDFWLCRVIKDVNDEYDNEEGKWLIEKEKISKDDFISKIHKLKFKEIDFNYIQNQLQVILDTLPIKEITEILLLIDDERRLKNWDYKECDSYEEVREILDDGFGIIDL